MSELYRAIAGSPITYLSSDISASQTTISIADDSALPDAPNICTIGYGENIETIRYGAKSNGVLQNVTRGIEGTPRAWPAGTEVARFFTAYDHNAIIAELDDHNAIIAELEDARLSDVKEKTFDTLKERLEESEGEHQAHLAETIEDDVHGLYTHLGDLRIINFTLYSNSSVKLKFSESTFICLLLMQGTQANAYGAFVLQGYGIGGTRYKVGTIQKGEAITVSIDAERERSFTLSNTSNVNASCHIVMFAGSPPEII